MKEDERFDHVYIWADGSIRGNPDGTGGLGILIESQRLGYVKAIGIYVPEKKGNTNNRMELMSATEALKALKDVPLVVHLHLDSMYVIGGINANGYESNEDLWTEFFKTYNSKNIVLKTYHVKGHSGEDKNTVVDKLANLAREKKKNIEEVGHSEEIIKKFS